MKPTNPERGEPASGPPGLGKHIRRDAKFAGKSLIELGISLIPYVGQVVGSALTALELKAVSIRLEEFVGVLAELAKTIDHDLVKYDYLKAREFEDIVIVALEAARRTSNRDKLMMIASILLGAATIDAPEDLDVEAVLTRIRDLSPAELSMARTVYQNSGVGTYGRAIAAGGVDTDFQVQHLEASGLLSPVMRWGPMGGSRFSGEHAPTPTFRRIMALMEAGGWKEPA
jgi:hypothetical protein